MGGEGATEILRRKPVFAMVSILDGNSEIGVNVLSKIGNLICLRHLFRSTAVTHLDFTSIKGLITFTRAQHELSYHKYHDFFR